jgi:ceramide glucosyltransferase
VISAILWLAICAGVGVHVTTALLTAVRFRPGFRPRTDTGERPFLSLIIPIRGREPFDRETLSSAFEQDYPAYELLFCAENEDDPAVELVRELIAAHPGADVRLLLGQDRFAVNPKINNLAKGYRAARSDLIVTADSNLLMPPTFLTEMLAHHDPDVGMVSSPPVATRPGNLWGALECAFNNSNGLRWMLAADTLGHGFVHGKAVLFARAVIEAGGGFEALGGDLGADVAMTKLTRRQRLAVRMVRRPFSQPTGRRRLGEVWERQLRWARVRRDGIQTVFLFEWAQGPLVPTAALLGLIALGAAPVWSLMVLALVWYGTEILLARLADWPCGWLDVAAFPLRDAMLPALWLTAWMRRGVTWRGREIAPATR